MGWGTESGRQGGEPIEALGDLETQCLMHTCRGREGEALVFCDSQNKDRGTETVGYST